MNNLEMILEIFKRLSIVGKYYLINEIFEILNKDLNIENLSLKLNEILDLIKTSENFNYKVNQLVKKFSIEEINNCSIKFENEKSKK